MANEYVIKNLPYNYSGRGRNYDFEGQDNGYLTGGFPATDPYGNQLSQVFPNGVPAIPGRGRGAGPAHLGCGTGRRPDLSQLRVLLLVRSDARCHGDHARQLSRSRGILPAGHDLGGISDYDFRRYDNTYADSDGPPSYGCNYPLATYGHYNMPSRFSECHREFQEMLQQDPSGNSVPAFMTVRFQNDHTTGYTAGNFSPLAEVADNDYAVGEIVDAVSHSPIWQNSAIFVIEDDAQDGPDHVDAHRSTAYLISPYIRQSSVDHSFYNTDSILHTIELLLGIPPMTQYDAVAPAIVFPFNFQPLNNAPFTAVKASQNIMCQQVSTDVLKAGNPMRKYAQESAAMNFDLPDSTDARKLNEIIWKSVKGAKSPVPAARHTVVPAKVPANKSAKDNDD